MAVDRYCDYGRRRCDPVVYGNALARVVLATCLRPGGSSRISRSTNAMRIDISKYGARPFEEDLYAYHIWNAQELRLYRPSRDSDASQAVDHALKQLGPGWELDHINPGIPLPAAEEDIIWPQLVFRKGKAERVLHRSYKNHDIRSSPLRISRDGTYQRSLNITNPENTRTVEVVDNSEPRYKSLEEAHAEGFKQAYQLIDEAQTNPAVLWPR